MEKFGKRFDCKVAIVTASTQGIGFGIAERLGLEGAAVVISSRRQVRFQFLFFLVNELRSTYFCLSVIGIEFRFDSALFDHFYSSIVLVIQFVILFAEKC